ncbi:MAG: ATPase, T2SS/T4P/T4SS family [Gammaproteobacteria bacterium]|nr:ATPase, T2SS/T4P/T4SS family [Gammaproteobacteria bacterium]
MAQILRDRIGVETFLTPSSEGGPGQLAETLREALNHCLAAHEHRLVINLEQVRSVSGTVLETLLDCQETLARRGGGLSLKNVNAVVGDALVATGLTGLLDEHAPGAPRLEAVSDLRSGPRLRLGEMLVEAGLATAAQIEEVVQQQGDSRKRLGQLLVAKGVVSEDDVLRVLAAQLDIPRIPVRTGVFDPEAVSLLDEATCRRLQVLPLFKVRDKLAVATGDPLGVPVLDEVEQRTGLTPRPVLASREEIIRCIREAFSDSVDVSEYVGDFDDDFEIVEEAKHEDFTAIDEMAAGSPIVNLTNAIIQRAIRDGASDVHIEPSRGRCRVRLRIDGVLHDAMMVGAEMQPALVSRLKVMANLDIAERRLPQDGRIQVSTAGRVVDLRFSSLPGIFGEKVVLRILDQSQGVLDIEQLGLSASNFTDFTRLLRTSHGLILVTGPTGSGKTTTLYAAINHLNSSETSIVTIEDPVEYQLDIINQNQVKEATGLTFARLLRHVLRQDPDIIMVGEIRDRETAEIAVQASLTGHLVLSTLHTNDAIGAITRLVDMGIPPYLLSSALIGAIGQRLVRTVCPDCKKTFTAPPELVKQYGWDAGARIKLAQGRGCETCYDSGYKGRIAIHEVLMATGALHQHMITNPGRDELRAYIEEAGVRTLFDDGMERVLEGVTTLEEVLRVAAQQEF